MKKLFHNKKHQGITATINVLLGIIFILAILKKQWLIATVLTIVGLLKLLLKKDKTSEKEIERIPIETKINVPEVKPERQEDDNKEKNQEKNISLTHEAEEKSLDKVSTESSFLITEIERINEHQQNKDLDYVVKKLIEMLTRLGFDIIEDDKKFDVLRHEAINASKRVLNGTPIKQTTRKGIRKDNIVYLRAKVIV